MKTKEERAAYMREYKERNRDKINEYKRNWVRAKRGGFEYKPEMGKHVISAPGYMLVSKNKHDEIEVEVCGNCNRKYLTKLYCVFCRYITAEVHLTASEANLCN